MKQKINAFVIKAVDYGVANPLVGLGSLLAIGLFGLWITWVFLAFLFNHISAIIMGTILAVAMRSIYKHMDKQRLADNLQWLVSQLRYVWDKYLPVWCLLIGFSIFIVLVGWIINGGNKVNVAQLKQVETTSLEQTVEAQKAVKGEVVCVETSGFGVVKEVVYQAPNTLITFESGNTYIIPKILTTNKKDRGTLSFWSKNGGAPHRALQIEGWPAPEYLINEGQ